MARPSREMMASVVAWMLERVRAAEDTGDLARAVELRLVLREIEGCPERLPVLREKTREGVRGRE